MWKSHIYNKSWIFFIHNEGSLTLGNTWYPVDLHCYTVNWIVIFLNPRTKMHINDTYKCPSCISPASIPVGPWQSPSPWQYVIPDPISISSTWETTSSLRWRQGPHERGICRKEGWLQRRGENLTAVQGGNVRMMQTNSEEWEPTDSRLIYSTFH